MKTGRKLSKQIFIRQAKFLNNNFCYIMSDDVACIPLFYIQSWLTWNRVYLNTWSTTDFNAHKLRDF